MVVALVFLVSVIIAMVLVLRSEMPKYWRVCIMLATVIFVLLSYLLAAKSAISPFGVVNAVSLGFWDRSISAIIATMEQSLVLSVRVFFTWGAELFVGAASFAH